MPNERSGTVIGRAVLRTQPDDRLIRLTREGHDVAYEEIVRRYRPRLVRQAAAIVPPHRAEDVVQESLARALPAIRSTDGEIALAAWLATIVRNRSLNDLRDEHGPHEELDDQYNGVPQPPTVAAQREEVRDVVVAIGALPEHQRRALVGRELEGRSHEEIAAELGITTGSARGLIFRARAAVRDALGALIPVPAVRFLMEAGAAEATGAATGAGAAVAGSSGGMKAAVGVLAVLATVGSGVAVERKLSDRDSSGPDGAARAEAATSRAGETDGSGDSGDGKATPDQPAGSDRGEDGRDESEGSGSGGEGSSSGPGSGDERESDDRSSHGGGDAGGDEDHSGPGGGGGGHSGSGGGGSSGPGGGDGGDSGPGGGDPGEPEEPVDDDSGSGNGEPDEDNSGSGSGDDVPEGE